MCVHQMTKGFLRVYNRLIPFNKRIPTLFNKQASQHKFGKVHKEMIVNNLASCEQM